MFDLLDIRVRTLLGVTKRITVTDLESRVFLGPEIDLKLSVSAVERIEAYLFGG